jgi:hypothetical protein
MLALIMTNLMRSWYRKVREALLHRHMVLGIAMGEVMGIAMGEVMGTAMVGATAMSMKKKA